MGQHSDCNTTDGVEGGEKEQSLGGGESIDVPRLGQDHESPLVSIVGVNIHLIKLCIYKSFWMDFWLLTQRHVG